MLIGMMPLDFNQHYQTLFKDITDPVVYLE